MAAAFKLRLVTAQRGGEVADMRWSNVDLDGKVWTIRQSAPRTIPTAYH